MRITSAGPGTKAFCLQWCGSNPAFFLCVLLHISKIIRTFAAQFINTYQIMKKFLFFAISVFALIACKKPDIPQPIGGTVDFTYSEISPLYIQFTSKATDGLHAELWDFGDGKYASGKETITHKYAAAGTYNVELDCKDKNGYSYTGAKKVTVKGEAQPEYTNAYIKGFKIIAIPNSGYYYSLEVHDEIWDEIGGTDKVQIKTSALPKTLNLKTRVNVSNAYVVSMWQSASKSGMPSPIFDYEKVLKLAELKERSYPAEVLLYNQGETAVNAIYEYE